MTKSSMSRQILKNSIFGFFGNLIIIYAVVVASHIGCHIIDKTIGFTTPSVEYIQPRLVSNYVSQTHPRLSKNYVSPLIRTDSSHPFTSGHIINATELLGCNVTMPILFKDTSAQICPRKEVGFLYDSLVEETITNSTLVEENVTNSTLVEENVTNSTLAEENVTNSTLVEENVTNSPLVEENIVTHPDNGLFYLKLVTAVVGNMIVHSIFAV